MGRWWRYKWITFHPSLTIVDAGQACDGVLAGFAGQVARLANELPMIKQEAKSYAVHHANDLLEPYRFEAAQDKMTGWATW
ncbi:hypothetical protein BFI45_19845 (plasmid) [Yersinia pestis subsp. microtus bv. Altaica]|uniref:hypothetical protein n=1 Tax=Yersinia pestis TaxID=632 RepID=UPI0001A4185C|nr:hypothetical protein [Yersinia pestis]AJK10300.1 hypothetical protein CH60_4241 [Yersinia pestis str. Pestoides B]EEO88082.1 hypothetical protein YPS_4850 [Yersinia pestis Pestoides A]AYW81550.1 hypothetical protein EGX42_00305 [Yersinia pestis]OVY53342.1 hypothetical protein BFI45_19845 [Yersinia pestis subsp. microtus bv. Altaica]OVY53791.1 hypothetical protein BFI46_19470 [Yersinia pestis subsp. microtus bv. Altaica]